MPNNKILLVEDDYENLNVARLILKSDGYKVYDAQNFKDVLLLIEEAALKVDLVILDLMLPMFSGLDIAKYLRVHPDYQNVPIIAMTARLDKNDQVNSLKAGCNFFLTKPYTVKQLLAPVNQLLSQNMLHN